MHESESGGSSRSNPEILQTSEIVCKNLHALLSDIRVSKCYDSALMAINTYIEQEYTDGDVSINELYVDAITHPRFPTEEVYEANREEANLQLVAFIYEYFGSLYEDSHSHNETNLWMIQLFMHMKRTTKRAALDATEGTGMIRPQASIVDGLAFSASTFSERVEQDGHLFVNETYVKVKRRLRLAHLDGFLSDEHAYSLYDAIDSAFLNLSDYGVDTSLVCRRIVESR